MWDVILALGLVLAAEGLLFAAFPDGVRRAMIEVAQTPSEQLRVVGLAAALLGVAIVWFARSTTS